MSDFMAFSHNVLQPIKQQKVIHKNVRDFNIKSRDFSYFEANLGKTMTSASNVVQLMNNAFVMSIVML